MTTKNKIKNTHKMAATAGRSWEIIHLLPLSFEILFFFWPCCRPCQILVPQPVIEPSPLAVEAQNLNLY